MTSWFNQCSWTAGPPIQVSPRLTYKSLVPSNGTNPPYAFDKRLDAPCPICHGSHIGLTLFLLITANTDPVVFAPDLMPQSHSASQQIYHPDAFILCPNATRTDAPTNPSLSYDPNFPRLHNLPGLPGYDPSIADFRTPSTPDFGTLSATEYDAKFWAKNKRRQRWEMVLRGMMPLQEELRSAVRRDRRGPTTDRRQAQGLADQNPPFNSDDARNWIDPSTGTPYHHGTIMLPTDYELPESYPRSSRTPGT